MNAELLNKNQTSSKNLFLEAKNKRYSRNNDFVSSLTLSKITYRTKLSETEKNHFQFSKVLKHLCQY